MFIGNNCKGVAVRCTRAPQPQAVVSLVVSYYEMASVALVALCDDTLNRADFGSVRARSSRRVCLQNKRCWAYIGRPKRRRVKRALIGVAGESISPNAEQAPPFRVFGRCRSCPLAPSSGDIHVHSQRCGIKIPAQSRQSQTRQKRL